MPTDDCAVLRVSVKDLFRSDNQYVVPSYQRNYAWTVDNAERLCKDLTEVTVAKPDSPTTNLLGAIVIKEGTNHSELEVVDGQQRLATLSLMFCAIRTYLYKFHDVKQEGIRPAIDNVIKILDNLLKVSQDRIRITLGDSDRELFTTIITSKNSDYVTFCKNIRKEYQNGKKRIEESHSLMIRNYLILCKQICEWMQQFRLDQAINNQDLNGVIESINQLSSHINNMTERNHFAYIRVYNAYVAYKIFNTFNSLGQSLLQADLIKSHLLSVAEKDIITQNNIKTAWQNIFDERIEKPDAFIYDSISSRWPSGKVNNIQISMANLYQIAVSRVTSSESVRQYVNDLKIDAKYIKQMDYPEDLDDDQKYDQIKNDLHGIRLLNARYIRVPILAAYREWGHDRLQDFQKLVNCLLIFFFKFKFINDGTAEAVRSIANNVTKDISDGESLSKIIYHILMDEDVPSSPTKRINEQIFPENFRQKMFKLTANTAKYVLSSLEIYIRKNENKEDEYPNYNFELEHILPKNHEKHWDEQKFLGSSTDSISTYKNRLGNLTLLSKKWNRNLGAKDFSSKKAQKNIGYAYSDFEINKQYLKAYEVWTASTLEKREEDLCRLAQDAWSLDKYAN